MFQRCEGASLHCASVLHNQRAKNGNEQTLYYSDDLKTTHKKCLPSCEFQGNVYSLSSTIYPTESAFPYMNESCLVFQKIVRICQSNKYRKNLFEAKYPGLNCVAILALDMSHQFCDFHFNPIHASIKDNAIITKHLFDYTRANVAHLKIYVKDPFYCKFKRDEQMTVISFIGNAGGLLGLCLGLSMISIFEAFFYIGKFIYICIKNQTVKNKVFKVNN